MTNLLKSIAAVLLITCCTNSLADEGEKSPTLAAQLQEMSNNSAKRLPPAMIKKFKGAIEEVRSTKINETGKQVGDKAVDGTLQAWDESEVTLSDLWKDQPLVITWYRGGWCPYCNVQLRAMEKALSELEGTGAKLVAITPELPANAKQTAEKNKLSFSVLHDFQNDLAHKYGIVFSLPESISGIYRDRLKLGEANGYNTMELPLAATYVVDRQGVIRYAFLDADYTKRAEPADVIEAVKKLEE